jgi:hypothetical protein
MCIEFRPENFKATKSSEGKGRKWQDNTALDFKLSGYSGVYSIPQTNMQERGCEYVEI